MTATVTARTATTRRTVPVDEILARADVLPGERNTPTRGERLSLLRAMRAEMNLWMWEFMHTASRIPQALLDGRLPEALVASYPADDTYPEQMSKVIAHLSGVVFTGDTGGIGNEVDAEAIGTGIRVMRELMAGNAAIHDGTWGFYPETLERHGLTVERTGELMRYYAASSLTAAAELLVAAHAVPIEDAQ